MRFRRAFREIKPFLVAIALLGAFGAVIAGRNLQDERRSWAEQSLVEAATLLSSVVRADLDHLVRSLTETGQGKLKPLHQEVAAAAAARRPKDEEPEGDRFSTSDYEFDRDFLDVSLWGRPEGSAKPKRLYLALNTPYITPAQAMVLRGSDTEAVEADLVQPAFSGQVVVSLGLPDWGSFALVAIPMGQGNVVQDVVVAHVRMSRFQRAFRWDSSTRAVLVNSDGWVLAQSGNKLQELRESIANHPLVQAMRSDTGASGSGQLSFVDSHGADQLGGYRRLNIGRLAVITMLPENEVLPGAYYTQPGALTVAVFLMISLVVGFVMGGGYSSFPLNRWVRSFAADIRGVGARSKRRSHSHEPGEPLRNSDVEPVMNLGLGSSSTDTGPAQADRLDSTAKRRVVTVLHGSVTQVHQLLEALGTEVAVSALNDFFALVAARVKEWGGEFEKEPGSSFIAVWGTSEGATDGDWRAVRCALELRHDFLFFNEIRKNDGEKPLSLGMGVDSGLALAGKLGPQSGFSVIGEVLACARKLGQLSTATGTDLLVSQDVWEPANQRFTGERAGEGKLSAESGARSYYKVIGYRDESGKEIQVEGWKAPKNESALTNPSLIVPTPGSERWLVNNGSQIVGPLALSEVANRLFAQELDFDCECWKENGEERSRIANSGMFTGSAEEGADIWLFDGESIHGPFTSGFLRTAASRKAVPATSFICEQSTVSGWKQIKDWEKTLPPLAEAPAPAIPEPELIATSGTPSDQPAPSEPVSQAPSKEAETAASTEPTGITEVGPETDPEEDYFPPPKDPDDWRSVA